MAPYPLNPSPIHHSFSFPTSHRGTINFTGVFHRHHCLQAGAATVATMTNRRGLCGWYSLVFTFEGLGGELMMLNLVGVVLGTIGGLIADC
ncbi:hypothetical protein Droror1_Dr00021031 [Drosera rotundifolia]